VTTLIYILISFIWGTTWFAIKLGLDFFPPFFSAGLRFAIASSILFLILTVQKKKVPLSPYFLRFYLLLGSTMFGVSYGLVYWGEKFIPSALASILFSTFPLAIAITAHLVLPDEKLKIYKLLGIFIGIAGVIVIFFDPSLLLSKISLFGALAIILSVCITAFPNVLVKRETHKTDPVSLNMGGMAVGSIFLLGLSLIFEKNSEIQWTIPGIGSLLYLAILGSVTTFVLYFWLMRKIPVTRLSFITFISPLVAVITGRLAGGEVLSFQVFLGMVLIFLGIFIADYSMYIQLIFKSIQKVTTIFH
jgi:drug/metabolite transporter (DMT)-like permease